MTPVAVGRGLNANLAEGGIDKNAGRKSHRSGYQTGHVRGHQKGLDILDGYAVTGVLHREHF